MAITNLQGTSESANTQQQNVNPNILAVTVKDPDKTVFSGNAVAVSTKNNVGPLDILPQHENFISIATGNVIVWLDKHQKQEIVTQKAIIKAESNKITIYIGVDTLYKEPEFAKMQPLEPAKKK